MSGAHHTSKRRPRPFGLLFVGVSGERILFSRGSGTDETRRRGSKTKLKINKNMEQIKHEVLENRYRGQELWNKYFEEIGNPLAIMFACRIAVREKGLRELADRHQFIYPQDEIDCSARALSLGKEIGEIYSEMVHIHAADGDTDSTWLFHDTAKALSIFRQAGRAEVAHKVYIIARKEDDKRREEKWCRGQETYYLSERVSLESVTG